MTERKPPGVSWESWVDRQIREARERGQFDDLPGEGKPIAELDRPYDEMWWVRRKLREERVSVLPPTLAVRKEVEEFYDSLGEHRSAESVRAAAAYLTGEIRRVNATAISGPPTRLGAIDADDAVRRWEQARAEGEPAPEAGPEAAEVAGKERKRNRRWLRFRRG